MAYKKSYKKRTYRKRSTKALTKTQVKAVAKIARAVDYRNDETKYITLDALGTNPTIAGLKTNNLTQLFTQGLDQNDMIGRSVHLQNLTIKGMMARRPTSSDVGMADLHMRNMLIWSNAEVPTSGNLSLTDIFLPGTYRAAGLPGSGYGIVDTSKCRVLYDKTTILRPNAPGHIVQQRINVSKKLDRTITFKSDLPASGLPPYVSNAKGNLYWVSLVDFSDAVNVTYAPYGITLSNLRISFKDA